MGASNLGLGCRQRSVQRLEFWAGDSRVWGGGVCTSLGRSVMEGYASKCEIRDEGGLEGRN